MKLGAEPRKLALLAVLLAVAGYLFVTNVLTTDTTPTRPPAAGSAAEQRRQAAEAAVQRTTAEPRGPAARPPLREFRPSLKPDRREQRADPMLIDPTLRLDLLAKVREVTMEGGERNLFQFGPAPAPKKPPEPKVIPKPPEQSAGNDNAKPADPAKPPPPPIPLKFFGYSNQPRAGEKRAFFLDGDEIFVASEGELIKKRYKVVRIGINSAVVEDVEHKHQQTLTLEEVTS